MSEISPALYRAGAGETVVLLHGFTGAWHHWRPVLADLVARFDVVAPTLAGHDGGPELAAGHALTIEAAVDSLESHLDDLGVGTAHIVGNSMGGALAIELARRGRAHSVVALSPGGGWDPAGPEALRIARFFARQDRMLRAARRRLPRVVRTARSRRLAFRDVMRRGELVPPADALALTESSLRCTIVREVLGGLRRDGGRGVMPHRLGEIDVPVLLAWARYDRVLPAATCAARFRDEIPGAEFRVLEGVGHVPMWDDSRLVAGTIADWVGRHATVAAAA